MNIVDFITELYCRIDDILSGAPQHSQAVLSISELVTIGVLYAIKNVSRRRFYDWLKDNYGALFPKLPERSRLFRRLDQQACRTGGFLAPPTVLGVADSYGVELGHPVRSGRNLHQVGKKGKSNHRWILGGKLCPPEADAQPVRAGCRLGLRHRQRPRSKVPSPAGQLRRRDDRPDRHRVSPTNVKICKRGQWNVRMIVETTFSMMTTVWGCKGMRHNTWKGFEAH